MAISRRREHLTLGEVLAWGPERIATEAAALVWDGVVADAQTVYGMKAGYERRAALARLAESDDPLDRYAAQLVATWDSSKAKA